MKHEIVRNYVDHKLNGDKTGYKILYDCYYKITKHKALSEYRKYYQHLTNTTHKDCKEYYQQIGIKLEKQRIAIGLKFRQEWNELFIDDELNQFPHRINLNEFRTLNDALWLIDNFAFKVQHSQCMKILRRCFDIIFVMH